MVWLSVLAALAALWLGADWVYARIVRARIRHWEQSFQWTDNGVREGCEAFEAGDPASPKAILLVHGLNDSPACYRQLAPELAAAGYYCRAIRLEGFGKSTADYAQGKRESWLEQIGDELQQLRAEHSTVHYVGHSLGGALGVHYLSDHPEAADRVVLLAPGIAVSNARSPLLSARNWHRVSNCLLWSTRVTASPFPLDAREVDDSDYPYRTPFTPRSVFDESFAVIDELPQRREHFVKPVLLAVSRNDKVIDWEAAEQFVQGSAAPVKEVEYFDDSGHALLVDHTASRLAQRMLEFLKTE
ncbi:MAG: alpha/beta fold hydrolase [Planctomycetales bacterium]|nr:alpha/beta fold hydrolase [Planctomycetales bacterium]